MTIEDLFTGNKNEITLRVKPSIKGETFQQLDMSGVRVTYTTTSDMYWLVDNKKRIEIVGIGPEDNVNLDLVTHTQAIFFVMQNNSNVKAEVKVRLFNENIITDEVIEIGFDDEILNEIDQKYSKLLVGKSIKDWLHEELVVEMQHGKTIELINNTPSENGFRIFGQNINIDVVNKNNKFLIKRIIKSKSKAKPTAILDAKIIFKDKSSIGIIRSEVQNKIRSLSTNQKYLTTWKKYQKKERELSLQKVKDIGFLKIKNIEKLGKDKYKLFYKEDKNYQNWLNKISNGDVLELVFKREFENATDEKTTKAKLINKDDDYLLLISEIDLEGKNKKRQFHYAILSISGDKAVQARRDAALKLIESNQTPIPQLPTIIEGMDTIKKVERKRIPLTPKVKKEFGVNGPNDKQEEALDIALNTPDIAIIQGPPGTGKTKVITAITKALTEYAEENNIDYEKEILLTAFQHDAVENMASRTTVLGLPTIKFGKRSSRVDTIDKWINETKEYIESQQFNMQDDKDQLLSEDELTYNDIKSHYLKYIETLDQEHAKKYFFKLSKEYMTSLPIEILTEISILTKESVLQDNEIIDEIQSLVKRIRTDSVSYEDDGMFNLKRFLRKYSFYIQEGENIPVLEPESLTFLNNILDSENITIEEYERLEEIKLNYLDLLTSGESVKDVFLPNIAIEKLFKKLIDIYSKKIKRSGSVYSILSEYHNDLTTNKENVKKTIESYSVLLASTIQGSKNTILTDMKESKPFDTVIVDEAARANPLDLNIPLTSAKRRIILVGDHRQLPHLIDDSIQRELADDSDIASDYNSHLEDSLFERLFIKLKELDAKNPNDRPRVVTLDTQYRMHPVIGNFISKTFYEKEGDPKIRSGTSADKLLHGLKAYEGKVAVSINVPNSRGKEEKYKDSTYRTVEAKEAIRVAKKILDEDPTLTVGVITFYSKQVEELFLEAQELGLVEEEKNEDSEFEITKEYSKTQNQEERFRIGSVDAFQGKEFDVVILSLVRSNNKIAPKSRYGFLTSYNRLNVAMSRAKKLLIAVGDENMFKDEKAKDSVYGLYAFYKYLIGSEDGISI